MANPAPINWTLFDAAGNRLGVVYAQSVEGALRHWPGAVTARPATDAETARTLALRTWD